MDCSGYGASSHIAHFPIAGVLVVTGMNNVEAFALGAVYGVGFEYTVGSGVAIFTGTVFDEYNGLLFFVRSLKCHLSVLLYRPLIS